jgi:hypothetical protein
MDYLSARFAKIDDAAAELGKQLGALVGQKQVARKAEVPQPKSQPQPPTQNAGVSESKPPVAAPTTAQSQPQAQPIAPEKVAAPAQAPESASTDATGRPSTEETSARASSSAAPATNAAGKEDGGNAAKVD